MDQKQFPVCFRKTADATRLLPALLLLMLALPAALRAQFDYSTNNGTITINRRTGSGGLLVIPETIDGLPVTSIGDLAFDCCTSLSNVTLPNSITNIGERAFGYCTNMSSINIPNGVLYIGNGALGGDFRLTSITIPDSVIYLGDSVFRSCWGLTNIAIGAGVTNLNSGMFAECTGLLNITVDARNTAYASIDGVLFNKSRTTLIQYPIGRIGGYAIPDGVTNIDAAFSNCANLTDIAIPTGVISIGDYAFYGCPGLRGVIIPETVASIGSYAFYNCENLYSFDFAGNAPSVGTSVFLEYNVTFYRTINATGWDPTFCGRVTKYWDPSYSNQQPAVRPGFIVEPTCFGFPIPGTNGANAVVEACTNIINPVWIPVGTKTFSGSNYIFIDNEWTNYRGRFYRIVNP